jgi:hypothetical protein
MDPHPDPDPEPAIFFIDANKKQFLKSSCLLLFKGTFTSFFKDKFEKKSQNNRNQASG